MLTVVAAFVAVVLRWLKHCGEVGETFVVIVVRWVSIAYCGDFSEGVVVVV